MTHQDPPAAVLLPGRAAHPLGTPVDPASSPALALGGAVQPRPGTAASDSTPGQSRPSATDPPSGQLNIPAISLTTASAGRRRCPQSACRSPANFPSTRIRARIIAPVTPSPPSAVLTPSIGGFGLSPLISLRSCSQAIIWSRDESGNTIPGKPFHAACNIEPFLPIPAGQGQYAVDIRTLVLYHSPAQVPPGHPPTRGDYPVVRPPCTI